MTRRRLWNLTLGMSMAFLVSGCSTATTTTVSTITSSTIGSLSFSGVTVQLLAPDQSKLLFSVGKKARVRGTSPASSGPHGLLQFALGPYSTTIYGFNVYRSTDGSAFTLIGTKNYGAPTSINALGTYFTYDDDATLTPGTTYSYEAQAFDAAGDSSVVSPVASSVFLVPFTLALASPTSGSTLTSNKPTLTFTLSETSLWSSSMADYFYFSVFVKDRTGVPCYYGEFRYNFAAGDWQGPGSYNATGTANWASVKSVSGLSYSAGVIAVNLADNAVAANNDPYRDAYSGFNGAFPLVSGTTYEWNVFGDWWGSTYDDLGTSGAMDPGFFAKMTTSSSGTGYGLRYADSDASSEGAANGSFSFSD